MLQVGIIGLGNAGNQVASLAQEKLQIPVVAVNSSDKDLEMVPDTITKKLIKDTEGKCQGAGKNRKLAKKLLKDSIMDFITSEEIRSFLSELDVVFIVSSTGGGTGSGTAPLMAAIIEKTSPELKTILVGITPVISDVIGPHTNTLEYLDELYTNLPGQTYMLYDNEKCSDVSSYIGLQRVNEEIVKDIDVIRCTYNYSTRFDSIDNQDMLRLLAFSGRIMVTRLEDIKEKDCDNKTIEEMLIDKIKRNTHVEAQRDKKVTASGLIINLSEPMMEEFDNHIPKVREFSGSPIHDFNHVYVTEDRKQPNNVFLILTGLTPVNDKIRKITDRIEELTEAEKRIEKENNALSDVDLDGLNKIIADDEKPEDIDEQANLQNIFDQFKA